MIIGESKTTQLSVSSNSSKLVGESIQTDIDCYSNSKKIVGENITVTPFFTLKSFTDEFLEFQILLDFYNYYGGIY